MTQTVQDVMTTELVLCDSSTSLTDAARMMRDQDIGDVLVTDGGELRGIVTDRDIVVRCVAEGSDISQSTLADACSAELISIAPDTSLDEAAQVMRDRAVRRLPVVDNGQAVGIVSLGDLAIERDPNSALDELLLPRSRQDRTGDDTTHRRSS